MKTNMLRTAVEKWLQPVSPQSIRVTQAGRIGAQRVRFVCIQSDRGSGLPCSLYFFLHGDGSWRVFPPCQPGRP